VRVGGLGSAIDRAFFIGEDKGFFADQGIKLDLTTFRGASEALPLLATDKLDVGTGGSNPGVVIGRPIVITERGAEAAA
jgi:ABC-type nitrate/sulfonate/bicarbonate transport system substrate-binding protein